MAKSRRAQTHGVSRPTAALPAASPRPRLGCPLPGLPRPPGAAPMCLSLRGQANRGRRSAWPGRRATRAASPPGTQRPPGGGQQRLCAQGDVPQPCPRDPVQSHRVEGDHAGPTWAAAVGCSTATPPPHVPPPVPQLRGTLPSRHTRGTRRLPSSSPRARACRSGQGERLPAQGLLSGIRTSLGGGRGGGPRCRRSSHRPRRQTDTAR